NSTGWLPTAVSKVGSDLSGWFLVASMVGIGMKTQLRELVTVGPKPVLLMLGETAFLAVLALALLRWVL
ncbi:MAG: putative sulfate exporter family transporter, partial [Herbaspirillum sp.]